MQYEGIIIEESLKDQAVMGQIKVTKTKVEPITKHHKTPWLKQWTLHTFEVNEKQAESVAELLGKSLNDNWYADFKSDDYHFIIFPDKIFKVDRSNLEQYKTVVEFGLNLGIPDYQLDFSPTIKQWEHPEKMNVLVIAVTAPTAQTSSTPRPNPHN